MDYFGEKYATKLALFDMVAVVGLVGLMSTLPATDVAKSAFFILPFLHSIAAYMTGLYHRFFERGYLREGIAVAKSTLFFTLLMAFAAFMLKERPVVSRRGLLYIALLYALIVYLLHLVERYYLKTIHVRSLHSSKLLVVTDKERLPFILAKEQSFRQKGLDLVQIALMDEEEQGGTYLSSRELSRYVERHIVDCVLIHLPAEYPGLHQLIYSLEAAGIAISLSLNTLHLAHFKDKRIEQFSDFQIITFSSRFHSPLHIALKRLLDIVGAVVGLFLCLLVGLVLAPLIAKDGGPVFFAQKRVGRNGRIFRFYKFRSMHVDAEARKKDLLAQNQIQGGMFKMENDPRVTPIGRFIRKTSLDELPQFFNVLRGDMSLVGTRPPTLDEYEQYSLEQKRRLSFKPGITGLWQISGRSDIKEFDQVVKLDVAYIDNWTIWSDIVIILKTIKVVIFREGAR